MTVLVCEDSCLSKHHRDQEISCAASPVTPRQPQGIYLLKYEQLHNGTCTFFAWRENVRHVLIFNNSVNVFSLEKFAWGQNWKNSL